jgi:hypothetical protein
MKAQTSSTEIVLSPDEQEALLEFFRHVYLGYDAKRMPLHRLLNRIDRAKKEQSV